jgi:hypothetical protein
MATRAVQGFNISTFTVKQDKVKVVLEADKDDIRTGDGGISDVLESLELHSTAADSSCVGAALRNSHEESATSSHELTVTSFTVKQDRIKIVLEAERDNEGDGDLVRALGIHSAENQNVELTMQRSD